MTHAITKHFGSDMRKTSHGRDEREEEVWVDFIITALPAVFFLSKHGQAKAQERVWKCT